MPEQAAPADAVRKQQVELARTASHHLLKGIKQIGMYRHAEAKFPEFLTKAHEAIVQYNSTFGMLQLKVDLTNFLLHGEELFTDESPIPYKFYRDGIRQLIFRQGFTLTELVTFTLVALSDPDRGAEDLNAQLWHAQLPHFEFIMVEGFRTDDSVEDEVQVEVDKVVDILRQRLSSNSDDVLRFARVTADDLEMQLSDGEQVKGVVITGAAADAALKARLQKEIAEEEKQRLFPKLISAVFQVVESGIDDAEMLAEMFTQLLDAMLLQEDFGIINQVASKLRAMEQRAGTDSAVVKLARNFVARMSDEQRLSRLGEVLKFSRLKNAHEVVRYLSVVPPSSSNLLLDVLDAVELPENRNVLRDVLIPMAKVFPAPFVSRLQTDKPQLLRDLVYILDRSDHPDKLKYFSTTLKSKNLATRLEVMSIVAKSRTGEARNLIASLLGDDNQQVRLQAARILPEFDREAAYLDLMRLINAAHWEQRDAKEREAIFAAIGSTSTASAYTYFGQILAKKAGLFDKKKVLEDKLLAVSGIGGAATIVSAKLLQEVIDDRDQPAEIRHAAHGHLARIRKQLLGSA